MCEHDLRKKHLLYYWQTTAHTWLSWFHGNLRSGFLATTLRASAVEDPAGLPASDWVLRSPPVVSKKTLNWAAIMPYRVGNPKTNPSASVSSSGVMIGDSLFGGVLILESASSGSVSGTCETTIHQGQRFTWIRVAKPNYILWIGNSCVTKHIN